MAGVVFVNPASGPDDTEPAELRRIFPDADVVECAGGEVRSCVRDALDRKPSYVAVAGGDGTMGAAANELVGGDVPLVVIPAGTRNHFAKDLGTATVERAASAARDGSVLRVDVGVVNGTVFVNNSSIGLYPRIVTTRKIHERRLPKGAAHLVAAWRQVRRGRRVTVTVGDETFRAWVVFVGNGEYGEGLLDLADRESLTDGLLDVRVVRADEPLARFRVVGALLLGRLARSPLVIRRRVRTITIDVRRAKVSVANDGEVTVMEPPLRYECRPAALPVLTPPEPD